MDTQKRYIKVENAPGWRRDRTNNAILNVNSVEAEKAKMAKKGKQSQRDEINTLKEEIGEIKNLLKTLVGKLDG
jgi:wobble nucleotide-excising tRNase